MFAQDSRYANQTTYSVTLADGTVAVAVRLPQSPSALGLAGFHVRASGDRLDQLAARYLTDATLFWMLCDANGTPAAAALESRPLIGIPVGGQ
jgi:hypothetical protein